MRRSMEEDLRKSRIRIPTALKEKEQKLTRMLLIIFACFLLSYGPGMLIKVVSKTKSCIYGIGIFKTDIYIN